jgi:hypothetical protein
LDRSLDAVVTTFGARQAVQSQERREPVRHRRRERASIRNAAWMELEERLSHVLQYPTIAAVIRSAADTPGERATAMHTLAKRVRSWLRQAGRESVEGQGLIEYSLILVLIFLACLAAVSGAADAIINTLWGNMSNLPF